MSHDPFATSPALPPPLPPPVAPAPWGLLGSIAWGAAGVAIWFIAQLVVVAVYIRIHASGDNIDFKQFESNGFLLALVTTIACPFWVGTMALASRLRGWRVRDYLALVMPRRSEVLFGIACLAALLIAFDLLTLAFGSDVVPPFMRDAYISARSSNSLVLFFIAVVVVGPITEEIAFRGFLFRGLSATWLGVAGTTVLTSAAWAAMHVQYDWVLLGQIFLIGLLLGWLRWASGSTLLTILLHVLANLAATIQAAIKVEWMG